MITGIHHVSFKCTNSEDYNKVIDFYKNVLEVPIIRSWETGIMFNTGNGIIEVFNNGEKLFEKGVINHFAFATDNVDEIISKVKAAGYEVFIEPKDIEIKSNPVYPARIAFCKGPLGEEIEFFQER